MAAGIVPIVDEQPHQIDRARRVNVNTSVIVVMRDNAQNYQRTKRWMRAVTNKRGEDRPVLEAVLESVEVVADIVSADDVIADVPILGTAFKVLRAVDSIRDRAFAAKLQRFILAAEALGDDAKEKMREKIRSNSQTLNT